MSDHRSSVLRPSVKALVLLGLVLLVVIVPSVGAVEDDTQRQQLLLGSSDSSCEFVTQRVQCGSKACINGTCMPCTCDADCYESTFACESGKCKLKPLRDTFDALTIFAPLSGILVCAVAVVAGVGGGGILVPLYVAFLGIPMSSAVGLSQATILGQSSFNVFLQLQRHHPKYQPPGPTRPAINYEYLALILPISLVGTILGSLGNKVAPDWLRVVLLFALLTYIVKRLIQRIKQQRAKDQGTKLLAPEGQAAQHSDDSDEDSPKAATASRNHIQQPNENTSLLKAQQQQKQQKQEAPDDQVGDDDGKPQYPAPYILLILLLLVAGFSLAVLKGRKLNLVTCNSGAYWGIFVVSLTYPVLITVAVRWHLKKLRTRVLIGELPAQVVPFKWNKMTTILFPALSVAAGGAASMLGIGGGLVLNFLLLEADLAPEQASATSGMATFLVAFQSAFNFWLQDQLRYDYGALLFAAGFISTILGQFVFVKQIKAHGWTFLIIAALAAIMVGSMLALTIFGIWDTYTILHNGGSVGFGEVCEM